MYYFCFYQIVSKAGFIFGTLMYAFEFDDAIENFPRFKMDKCSHTYLQTVHIKAIHYACRNKLI